MLRPLRGRPIALLFLLADVAADALVVGFFRQSATAQGLEIWARTENRQRGGVEGADALPLRIRPAAVRCEEEPYAPDRTQARMAASRISAGAVLVT